MSRTLVLGRSPKMIFFLTSAHNNIWSARLLFHVPRPKEVLVDVTESHTESLLDIVKGIDQGTIMLPEFQRDFRWELEQTFDLFDSLVRDIFIGTIIYGKPSFGMTLREIDKRPRRGANSRAKINVISYNDDQIKKESQVRHLRIVLDGQQRITSIYRALTGRGDDRVYLVLNDFMSFDQVKPKTLEEMTKVFQGEPDIDAVSVLLSDAYQAEREGFEDEKLYELFDQSPYGKSLKEEDPDRYKEARRVYRWALFKLKDLFKMQKMVAYYLLDMSLDKFCLFFERSNSRGILLNFTDILAAKLYHGFNLREKIEDYTSQNPGIRLNREVVIRAIAYIHGQSQPNKSISIDKKTILTDLTADEFTAHWDTVCRYYTECINYLTDQHYILSQGWIPSENMILPLMMFRRQIKSFDQMSEPQRRFIEFWFWASVFSNRYSGSSNEVIIADSKMLEQVAKGEKIPARACARMRSRIDSADDLFNYTKRGASIYRGVLNLIAFEQHGLRDWNNTQKLTPKMDLEGHHIFPRAYIHQAGVKLDVPPHEADELVDSVVNITLIPKLTNIKIGKRPPSGYLSDLLKKNPQLPECLSDHLVDPAIISDASWDTKFMAFLKQRADRIFGLIQKIAVQPIADMAQLHELSQEGADDDTDTLQLPRLRSLLARGLVQRGDVLLISKDPTQEATLVDDQQVNADGILMPINLWAQKVTGWSSVNIYLHVVLKRTGQTLQSVRIHAAEESPAPVEAKPVPSEPAPPGAKKAKKGSKKDSS